MSQMTARLEEIFGEKGILSEHIADFSPRLVQLQMATAVGKALESSQVLVVEAGTGTGKTYAYLIPSLISGKKVIISTGTKNLQDQLFFRDIPIIRKALGAPLKIALLKGRSNYLCLHRLEVYLQADFITRDTLNVLTNVKIWSQSSPDGEVEHIEGIKLEPSLQPYITSTADNCLGQDCEFFSKCFLLKARRKAQEAGLLIINHHLFFADSELKEAGITDLLPDAHAVIFDEAHQLHETATHFLGESLSSRQLTYLARDIQAEQQLEAPDMIDLKFEAGTLSHASKKLLEAFGNVTRGSWEKIVHKPELKESIARIKQILKKLQQHLEIASVRSKGLENCLKRTADLSLKFELLTDNNLSKHQIHWFEVHQNYFSLHHSPLNIADYFQKLIQENLRAWIFTSATLSVGGDFSHFDSLMGLSGASHLHLESNFNYSEQALLYLPKIDTHPHEYNYLSCVLTEVIPLLKITRGRAFFLFTSHKALREAAIELADKISYPLLVQGTLPKSQLLERFSQLENAVLLGTSSFWEGVDVKGSKLSCVIIDKIPFASPDDPILKSRLEHYRKLNLNPFTTYQLPQAVIMLRQGAGRLIRDQNDYGVLMLCDPRLKEKDYGELFLKSLPPTKIAHHLDEVSNFLKGFEHENSRT